MNQHQQTALEAAIAIRDLCKENNIDCFLLAGSVLGAIRHKGFIPWDDDIDLGIRYKDLQKFQVISSHLPEKFKYISVYTNKKYPRFNGKVLVDGVSCVDVFPLVKLSDNKLISSIQWKAHRVLIHVLFRKKKYNPKDENPRYRALSKVIALFFTKNTVIKLDELIMGLCESKDTQWFSNLTSKYTFQKELIKAEWINKPCKVMFEGEVYMAPGNIDAYLTNLYKDYMELPSETERIPVHEESFEEFLR